MNRSRKQSNIKA